MRDIEPSPLALPLPPNLEKGFLLRTGGWCREGTRSKKAPTIPRPETPGVKKKRKRACLCVSGENKIDQKGQEKSKISSRSGTSVTRIARVPAGWLLSHQCVDSSIYVACSPPLPNALEWRIWIRATSSHSSRSLVAFSRAGKAKGQKRWGGSKRC